MNISIFDSDTSEVYFFNKFHQVHAVICIADTVYSFANSEWSSMFHLDLDKTPDDMIIALFKRTFAKDKNTAKFVEKYEELTSMIKQGKKLKQKQKEMLLVLARIKPVVDLPKRRLKEMQTKLSETAKLNEVKKFFEENIWQIPYSSIKLDAKKEDVYIQPIYEKMLQRDNLFSLDEKLEEFFTPTLLDAPETTDFDFIKIPLWEIQLAKELTYNQIKYTRDDLQPALLPFKANLKELSEELIGINFLPENMARIKQLCREKLLEHIAPVQQSLNDSLYLSHLRNQSAENTDSKLFLGIASAEMLLNYFDKIKLVQPYVISEIKQRLARHFDLNASCIFSYLQIHPSSIIPPETNASQ